jgi:hypothetical protein
MPGIESAGVQSAVAAVAQGMSVLQAAKQFECSSSSIHRALRRRGLTHQPSRSLAINCVPCQPPNLTVAQQTSVYSG